MSPAGPKENRLVLRWAYPIAVGLPLIVLNGGWIAHSEMKTGVTEITIQTLFMGVTFILFVVTLVNLLVRRFAGPRAAMSQPELMTLYAMLSMSSVVAGIGNLGFFTPFLTNAFWFGTTGNRWPDFWPLLPAWAVGPRDREILKGYYEGHSSFFRPDVLAAWATPLVVWGVFFFVLLATLLCLSAIVFRRWHDDEHLPFPVVALPLEMTREAAPLYRERLLWAGFAVPCVLHSINTLHGLYPSLPSFPINTARDLVDTMSPPWNGLGSLTFLLHPCAVGFGYLVNTDVLFSLWFFYLLKKVLNLAGTAAGWRDPGPNLYGDGNAQFPYWGYQAWGAWLAVSVAVLWAGRGYFRGYFARAARGGREPGEPLSARAAVFGFAAGFLLLCAFAWALGASLWLPVGFFGIYFLLMTALSRLAAETAVLSPLLAWVSPQAILPALTGTSALALTRTDLASLGILSWFNLDYRAAAMPQELQAFAGLKRAGAADRLRPFVFVLLLAVGVSIVSALLWDLSMYYANGAATANVNQYRINMGKAPWNALQGWLNTPKPPDRVAPFGMAAGAGVTFLLSYLRTRFVGFPFAPAAYVLNTSWANELFWGDMAVAWVFKAALLRYGGRRMYHAALPFFLGLILGDFVTGSAWSIVGTLLKIEIFRTFPN
jgi:uncharacterized membrane protein YhaH (DUF805 family)